MEVIDVQKNSIDLVSYLQNLLLDRCRVNSNYSLRSFAKSLNTDPSLLSKILNRKRKISSAMSLKLMHSLGFSPEEMETFCRVPQETKDNALEYKQLMLDQFKIISDWYHFAILELIGVDHFENNPKWISNTLGININEARIGLERLFRVGLINIDNNTVSRNNFINISNFESAFNSSAHKHLQRGLLSKAIIALDETAFDKRDQTSMTMAIDSDLLPNASDMITKFRRKLCNFLENGEKKDCVYNLSISLFPLSLVNNSQGEKNEISK